MSINHFSSDPPQSIWWGQQQPHINIMEPNPIWSTSATKNTSTNLTFNLNQQEYEEEELQSEDNQTIKEAMFEKSLTPSDVGKLNRLVIPKQHAERYFPLGSVSRLDSGEKGLLLNFEDDLGKLWRFRYSYWSSSQSYVLTKGWSRFVKEKRLDAGDVVFFERHPVEADRFFIGWRRRATSSVQDSGLVQPPADGGGWTRVFYTTHPYPSQSSHGSLLPYQPDCLHAGPGPILANQTTAIGKSKRLRLFGVNLECQPDEPDPPATDGSPLSTVAQPHYQYHSKAHSSDFQNHMDINFSRDVNQMRHHQG